MKELIIVKESLPQVNKAGDKAALIVVLLILLASGLAIAWKVQQDKKEKDDKKYSLDQNGKFVQKS